MVGRVYYPLSVLADRWACTVQDLLHLGIQDRAQVCVNIYGMAPGTRSTRMHVDGSNGDSPDDGQSSEPLTDEECQEAEPHDAAFDHWTPRTTRDMPHGVFELTHETLRFLDMPNAFPHELDDGLKFDGGWWECEFDPPVAIGLDHLCMLHQEVVRLDREEFGATSPANTAPGKDEQLSARAETTYLNIIGGLLGLMLGKSPSGNPQSAFINQDAIIDALIANYEGKLGISRRTLEGKFSAAKRSLTDKT